MYEFAVIYQWCDVNVKCADALIWESLKSLNISSWYCQKCSSSLIAVFMAFGAHTGVC